MKTGILLDHTAFTPLNYLVISEVNRYVGENVDDVIIYCQNVSNRIMEPHCAVIDTSEVPVQTDGCIVAFDLSGAQNLRRAFTPATKVLFLWNLEWLYHSGDFNTIYDILTDPNIKVVVRTDMHARVVENMTNTTPAVLEEFNLEKLHAICGEEQK